MATYEVRWLIELEADNEEQAAEIAREIQRDVNSTATYYEIMEKDEKGDRITWRSVELKPGT